MRMMYLAMLVAQLALDAQPDRRAVLDRQRRVVELVGEDRLRMVGVVEVDAFVVRLGAVILHRVGAIEHHVARLRARLRPSPAARESFAPFHLPIALQPSTQS